MRWLRARLAPVDWFLGVTSLGLSGTLLILVLLDS